MRISVTHLTSLQYWKSREESTVEDLIADLTYKKDPTPQMLAGRAFAKLMEHATDRDMELETMDGWTFDFREMAGVLHLPEQRELKATATFATPSGPVTLVGKCDGVTGILVRDAKLTEKLDAEKYLDSLQWRAYLDMFEASVFVYDLFLGSYKADQRVVIRDYQPIRFFRYPDMRRDVERAVAELAEIVVRYDIKELLGS